MTENLLQKLEEKMMSLLTEVEDLRKQVHQLGHENAQLLAEKESSRNKIADLISLLDTITTPEHENHASPLLKPILMQA